ncbi:uncharacterized protein LOC116176214 [Photinus pyralis]|uniref:uncharacterized protein LOC116176214 n=1 Tax=Photinus pyralis TaxID=7054 RepID=UPI00126753D4|nr:uncharacterized protein LOC116176214 [Photinus pyralis]
MVKICSKSKSIVNFNTSDLYLNCVREEMVFLDKKDWSSSADKGLAFIGLVKLSYKTNTGQIVPLSYNDAPEKAFDANEISLRRCDPTYSFRTGSSSSINPSVDVSHGGHDSMGRRSLANDEEYPSRDIDVAESIGNEMVNAGTQATPNSIPHKSRRQEREPTGHRERRANVPLLPSTNVYCTKKYTDYRKPEIPHEGPLSIIFSVDSLLPIDDNSAVDRGEALDDDTSLAEKPSLIECITISKSLLGRSRLDDHVAHDSKEVGDAHLYQTIPLANVQDLIKELVDNYIAKKRKSKITRRKRRLPHGCRSKLGYVLDSTSESGSNLLDSLEESDSGDIHKTRGECNNCQSLKQRMQVMMYKRDGSCHPIYSDRNNYRPPKEPPCNCCNPAPEKKRKDNDDLVFISVPVNKMQSSAVTLIPKESQKKVEPKKPSFFQRMRAGNKTKQDANAAPTEDELKPSYEVSVKRSNSALTYLNDEGHGFNTVVNVTCPHHSSSSDDSECSPCCKHYQVTPTIKPSKIPLKKREVGERNCCVFKKRHRTDSVISSSTSPLNLLQDGACQRCCNPTNTGYPQWAHYQPCPHQLPCPPVLPQYRYCDLCSNAILYNGTIDQYNDDYDYTNRERGPSLTFSETPKRSPSKSSINSDPKTTCCMFKKDVKRGTHRSSQVDLEFSHPPPRKTPSRRFFIFNRPPKENRPFRTTSGTSTINGSNKPETFDKATNVNRDHSPVKLEKPLDRRVIEPVKDFSTNTDEQSRKYHQSSQVNFETPQSIPEADRGTATGVETNKYLHEESQGKGCCSRHFFKSKPSNGSIKKSTSRLFPEKKPKLCSEGTCNCARDEKCISCACSSATVNYTFCPVQRQPERSSKNCACLERNKELKTPVGPTTRCIPTRPPECECPKPQLVQQPQVSLHAVEGQTTISVSCLRDAPAEVEIQDIVLNSEDTCNLHPRPVASLRILYPQNQSSTITSRYNCEKNIKASLRCGKSGSPATIILRDGGDTSAPAHTGNVNNYVIKMYPEQDTMHTRSGKTIKRLARKMNELEGVYYDTLQRFHDKRSRKVRKHVIRRSSLMHSKTLRMAGDAHPRDRSLHHERKILHDVAGGVDLVLEKLRELSLIMNNQQCH